jgi:hypothetical protein
MIIELTYNTDFATLSHREKFESFGTSLPFFISVSNPARIASFAFFVTSIFSVCSDIDVSNFDDLKRKNQTFLYSCFIKSFKLYSHLFLCLITDSDFFEFISRYVKKAMSFAVSILPFASCTKSFLIFESKVSHFKVLCNSNARLKF